MGGWGVWEGVGEEEGGGGATVLSPVSSSVWGPHRLVGLVAKASRLQSDRPGFCLPCRLPFVALTASLA